MTQTARLITPQGQEIPLSPEVYQAILDLLEQQEAAVAPPRELEALVEEALGKYAGEPSLLQALLAERKAEREREAHRPHG